MDGGGFVFNHQAPRASPWASRLRSDIEYTDEITMLKAMEERRELQGQKRAGRVLFQPFHHEQLRQLAEIAIGI